MTTTEIAIRSALSSPSFSALALNDLLAVRLGSIKVFLRVDCDYDENQLKTIDLCQRINAVGRSRISFVCGSILEVDCEREFVVLHELSGSTELRIVKASASDFASLAGFIVDLITKVRIDEVAYLKCT